MKYHVYTIADNICDTKTISW